jgi:hypothetical protein
MKIEKLADQPDKLTNRGQACAMILTAKSWPFAIA